MNQNAINANLIPVVEKLKKYHSNPNLKQLIEKAYPNQKPNVYFTIRSEIFRLAKDCKRCIDLRGKLKNEECSEIEHNNMRHYLNESGLLKFKELLNDYKDSYTFGVYEGVFNYIKELQKKEITEYQESLNSKFDKKDEKLQYINYSDFNLRKEERMYFAVEAKIYHKNEDSFEENVKRIKGFQTRNEYLEHHTALTVDISESGLSIKVSNKVIFDKDEKIIIRLTGVEEELVINNPFLEYRVIKVQPKGRYNYIALQKIEHDINKEINNYVSNLITGYKKRYKVDIGHVIEAVRSKVYEQYYVSRLNCLPIYLKEHKNKIFLPKYAFMNDNNEKLIEDFQGEYRHYFECSLLHSKMHYIIKDKDFSSFYIAFFNFEKEGRKYFYSLASERLNESIFDDFISYGLTKGTLKLFKMDVDKVDSVKDGFIPSSLPDNILNSIAPYEKKMSTKVESMVNDISYLAVATDLTAAVEKEFFLSREIKRESLKILQATQVKEYPIPKTEYVRIEDNDFRIEDRFLIQTSVEVKNSSGRELVKGYTSDVSGKGFRARMDKNMGLKVNDKIKVTFDDHISNPYFPLEDLIYKVVHVKGNTFACRIVGDSKLHNGFLFWRKYIYANHSKLNTTGNSHDVVGFSKTLRNIFAKNYKNLPCYYEVVNKQVNPYMLAFYEQFKEQFSLFKNYDINEKNIEEKLKPVFFNQNFLDNINNAYKEVSKDTPFVYLNYYVNVKKKANNKLMFKFLFEEQVGSTKEKDYLLNPEDGSETFVFQLQITRKQKVFNKYFKSELMYVESYANYRAEEVYDEIKKVSGVIEFKDITSFAKAQTFKMLS